MTKQVELPTAITEAEVSSPSRLAKMLQLNFDAIVSFISSLEIKTDTIDSSVTDLNESVEFIDGKEVDGENDFSQETTGVSTGVIIRGDAHVRLRAGVNASIDADIGGITLSAADDSGVLKPVFLNGSVVELTHGVPLRIGDDVSDTGNRIELRSTGADPSGTPDVGYAWIWYNASAGTGGIIKGKNGVSTQQIAAF